MYPLGIIFKLSNILKLQLVMDKASNTERLMVNFPSQTE